MQNIGNIALYMGVVLGIVAFIFHLIAASHHKEGKESEALNGWSIFSSEPYNEKGNYYRKRALSFYIPALIFSVIYLVI